MDIAHMARLAGHLLTDDPRKKRPGFQIVSCGLQRQCKQGSWFLGETGLF